MRSISQILVAMALGLTAWTATLPLGTAMAQTGARRADMLAMGVDMTPVGTARQVERTRRTRRQMP